MKKSFLKYWEDILPKIVGQDITLVNSSGVRQGRLHPISFEISRNGQTKIVLILRTSGVNSEITIDGDNYWTVETIHKD